MTYTDFQKWVHDNERAFMRVQHRFPRKSRYYHQGLQFMEGKLEQGKAKKFLIKLYEVIRDN